MARWKLTEAHYINACPPDLEAVEWEYKETDRVNGRERRKRFEVPFYCDVETIVCYAGKGLPTDTVFRGPPTPAMTPLDEEAKAISAEHSKNWVHPIESLPGQGFNDGLLATLQKQLAELTVRTPVPVAQAGVSVEEFNALKEQLALLTAQLAERPAPSSHSGVGLKRRV